jgi:hypothetical protein
MLVERYEVDEKRLSAAPRSSSSESDHSTKVIAADVVRTSLGGACGDDTQTISSSDPSERTTMAAVSFGGC